MIHKIPKIAPIQNNEPIHVLKDRIDQLIICNNMMSENNDQAMKLAYLDRQEPFPNTKDFDIGQTTLQKVARILKCPEGGDIIQHAKMLMELLQGRNPLPDNVCITGISNTGGLYYKHK